MSLPKIIAYSKLLPPPAGLGNNLFIWAKGVVFAQINNCPHYISSWTKLHFGAIKRKENTYRFYFGYFNKPTITDFIAYQLKNLYYDKKIVTNCTEVIDASKFTTNTAFIFDTLPHWKDHFEGIKAYRELVRNSFNDMLSNKIKNILNQREKPFIGVHIRMGDFAKYNPNIPFANVGSTRTPLEYFEHLIKQTRSFYKQDVPVTLFSDGSPEDLEELLALPNVKLSVGELDIVDMLLLSQSRIIICAAGSTFSAWAGFLSDAPMIKHYDHLHEPYRDEHTNSLLYEGAAKGNFQEWDSLLLSNLQSLREYLV
jgi:hypothetical protein